MSLFFAPVISSKSLDIVIELSNCVGMETRKMAAINDLSEAAEWVELVKQSVRDLQFGVVQIVVHNAKVVQIEKTEKLRLEQSH